MYIQKSAERLWKLSEEAEEKEDIKLALIACRSIRRGFYASRSIYQPGSEWIKKCDARIDHLNGLLNSEEAVTDGSKADKQPALEKQEDVSPDVAWTLILEIGFIGCIGSVIFLIFSLSRRKGKKGYPIPSIITYTVLTILFFSIWAIGMMKA
jgi:hypothetical protein